jgi:hypothetical protein
MLERLMKEIRSGGTLQPAVLASRLGTSPGLVEMMLEDLERRGLLTRMDSDCGSTCGGCALSGDCGPAGAKGRMWMYKPPAA